MIKRFTLLFYSGLDGKCQVRGYLRASSKSVRAEAGWLLTRLQEEGDKLERPAAGYLEDGIHELRIVVERNHHRVLYFFFGRTIVATNAFLKNDRTVPRREIKRAQKARWDWLKRREDSDHEKEGEKRNPV